MNVAFRATGSTRPKIFRREVTDAPLLISGGTIRDASGTLLDHDILVESFQISRVAPEINTDATVFDASGMLVLPGLVHPWFDPRQSTTLEVAERLRQLFMQGVTTVHVPRIPLEQGYALRQAIAENLLEGPRVILSVSLQEAGATGPLLGNLRRALGFGVDLVVIDDERPRHQNVAREVAADLKRHAVSEAEIRAAARIYNEVFDIGVALAEPDRFLEDVDLWTARPAGAMGLGASVGAISAGRLADLLLLRRVGNHPELRWQPMAVVTASSNR